MSKVYHGNKLKEKRETTTLTLYYASYSTALIFVLVFILVVLAIGFVVYRALKSPFEYPYFDWDFDVSGKRNVHIEDYIDRFLCNDDNWLLVQQGFTDIEHWKHESESYLKDCRLRERRTRQYQSALDDDNAFCFHTFRDQTRYRQQNYVKTSYKVSVPDDEMGVSWQWLVERHSKLASINFEATLRDYHAKNQRRLMTKELREKIKIRDNYTCQVCGKYMPDEVGLQIDHIIPVARGGKSVPSNLRVLCSKCNGAKGAKRDGEF